MNDQPPGLEILLSMLVAIAAGVGAMMIIAKPTESAAVALLGTGEAAHFTALGVKVGLSVAVYTGVSRLLERRRRR